MDELSALVKKIKNFSDLEENWDSYGAGVLDKCVIDRAIKFLKRTAKIAQHIGLPHVAPASDGTIHFGWAEKNFEFRCVIPRKRRRTYLFITNSNKEDPVLQIVKVATSFSDLQFEFSKWAEFGAVITEKFVITLNLEKGEDFCDGCCFLHNYLYEGEVNDRRGCELGINHNDYDYENIPCEKIKRDKDRCRSYFKCLGISDV
jgi:hypothetical protein